MEQNKPEQRNIKNSPFSWQEKRVLRYLNKTYSKKEGTFKRSKLTTAMAIYESLTYYASNHNEGENGGFPASYRQIGGFVGKSAKSAQRYCNEFIEIKILAKKIRKRGEQNEKNFWTLTPLSYRDSTFGHDGDPLCGKKKNEAGHNYDQPSEHSNG